MVTNYIPASGDVVWLDFNPTRGHEQASIRPALVISNKAYNEKTGMVVLCPVTSIAKGYPFEVAFRSKKINGSILVDHIRSVDWKNRGIRFVTRASEAAVLEVREKLAALIF